MTLCGTMGSRYAGMGSGQGMVLEDLLASFDKPEAVAATDPTYMFDGSGFVKAAHEASGLMEDYSDPGYATPLSNADKYTDFFILGSGGSGQSPLAL